MSTFRYEVTGMTCSHCVASVREEVGAIDGVTAVSVDLVSGLLTVEAPTLADDDVFAAVTEAGYTAVVDASEHRSGGRRGGKDSERASDGPPPSDTAVPA